MGAAVTSTPLGSTIGHKGQGPTRATAFQLDNGAGVSATVWDYGGHLVSVQTPDREGVSGEIVLCQGSSLADYDLADYDQADGGGYVGSTIGRYANRIAGGRFSLDGQNHRVTANEGQNHLHGGAIGFDRYVWSAEPFEGSDECGVRLNHSSPDGDEGYPGRLDVVLTYSLSVAGELTFDYRAVCDRPTIVNLTNHAYWNLAGGGSVLGHELEVVANEYLPVDQHSIPRGRPQPVDDTVFDFREARPIAESYDHCFVLALDRAHCAVVSDAASGRTMTITTDQPGLQIYTGQHLSGRDSANPGLCLETQHLPNSPNRPDFPSAVLRPGEVYRHRTTHTFGVTGS